MLCSIKTDETQEEERAVHWSKGHHFDPALHFNTSAELGRNWTPNSTQASCIAREWVYVWMRGQLQSLSGKVEKRLS